MKQQFVTFLLLATFMISAKSGNNPAGIDFLPQQDYNGTYVMTSQEVQLTLSLRQESTGKLSGTLTSNNGTTFTLEGMVEYGTATGICRSAQGGVFFEAYLDGNDLTFSLIEPDANNMPDYDRAQYLVLSRTTTQGGPVQRAQSPLEQLTNPPGNMPPRQQAMQEYQPTMQQNQPVTGNTTARTQAPSGYPMATTGNETAADEINGYAFRKPAGWNHQLSEGYILLGSNTVPGLILTFPHQLRDMGQMMQEMRTGIQEEGISLSLSGNIQQQSANLANCFYEGMVQGEQAKAYGIGVLNASGGGIFILAVSTPDKLGNEIISAANTISMNTTFKAPKAGDQDLVRHFSGEWAWSNGYRTEWLMFYPDGTFSDQYEAAYSGNTTDGYGNQTGAWGAANQSQSRGRWNIQGTRDAGVINVVGADGSQTRYEYRVFVENGEKYYREYILNGYHYRKNKDF